MAPDQHDPAAANMWAMSRKLEAAAWGLFFIWVGVALLAHVPWWVGLMGVGIITLGAQLARWYFDLRVETFWVLVGCLFLASGVWELFSVQVALVPIVLIVAGGALLVSAARISRTGR